MMTSCDLITKFLGGDYSIQSLRMLKLFEKWFNPMSLPSDNTLRIYEQALSTLLFLVKDFDRHFIQVSMMPRLMRLLVLIHHYRLGRLSIFLNDTPKQQVDDIFTHGIQAWSMLM